MSTYIHFTEEQKQRAASVDLESSSAAGAKLLASGREKRLARDHSVTIRGNEWYDHAEERAATPSASCSGFITSAIRRR